ncbi:hypothetical protein [Flavobacterium sp. LC2016-12]|uniref:hypothetical protein n=1 Tax=Flavobacterium sp. LC2016-12 TaxID=2783794 RepID=UPI001889F3AE|nr:hypothetical protein [Flavobacterium sp. LC2016-12]MBF4465147.1 hypothetical protein [Flavobacterium sp. LC2016-12]
MSEIIIGSLYHQILDNLLKEIDLSILPLYGENEIYRMNSDRYGKVKIKLDIEKDTEKIEYARSINNKCVNPTNFYTYEWEVKEEKLPKYFEEYIKPEILRFIEILSTFNNDKAIVLKFSVVDGEYKNSERPAHHLATKYALIELFRQV